MVSPHPGDKSSSQRSPGPGSSDEHRASRACEKCTRIKKKCDKALPACGRCDRLGQPCTYEFIYIPPTMTVMGSSAIQKHGQSPSGGEHSLSSGLGASSAADPDHDFSAAAIMANLMCWNVDWRESVRLYMSSVNVHLRIVEPSMLDKRLTDVPDEGPSQDSQLALLILTMHLATLFADSGQSQHADPIDMFTRTEYVYARRMVSLVKSFTEPSILLLQCCAMIAGYEFSHGSFANAYFSLGDCASYIMWLGVSPGKHDPAQEDDPFDPGEEEARSVYWAVFMMDRLIHLEADILTKPLHLPLHQDDDLLPTVHYIWDPVLKANTHVIRRYPVLVHESVPLGSFQRNVQCAVLWSRAIEWERASHDPANPPSVSSFAMIDISTRNLIQAVLRQAPRWGDHYACFASLTTTLLLLYGRYLESVGAGAPDEARPRAETAMAVAGLNFTVRMIADKTADYNQYLAERPELLGPCSPVTPYSLYHCLVVLQRFGSLIPDSDQRFCDLYSSLHSYAKRWAVGSQLAHRLEGNISLDLKR